MEMAKNKYITININLTSCIAKLHKGSKVSQRIPESPLALLLQKSNTKSQTSIIRYKF